MKQADFKLHAFNEILRFTTILMLVLFSGFLIGIKSDLARDVILLIIGVIGGKYLKA